jgi:acetoin utilization protein AcuC
MTDQTPLSASPVILTHELFQSPRHPSYHPLSIERSRPFLKILETLGWAKDDDIRHIIPATREDLAQFHAGDYLDALELAARGEGDPDLLKRQFHLGTHDNPIMPTMAERATLLAGGAIMAARLAMAHGTVFNPAGGAHHGMPNRANGFCFTNDPVFAILTFLNEGLKRVAYIDLDAHHGDGVENAFLGDERVLLISVHEQDRWPATGKSDYANAINRPVRRGFSDDDLLELFRTDLMLRLEKFKPDALVILSGADALAGDPLMRLAFTNSGLVHLIRMLLPFAPHRVILGGGGYNPWLVARYWTVLWATLTGRDVPKSQSNDIQNILSFLTCPRIKPEAIEPQWLSRFAD